jgi:hypothetical protein
MRSGAAYSLAESARYAFWLPLARVTICNQLLNVDGEVLTHYELRNALRGAVRLF